jgi:hypothetical protein
VLAPHPAVPESERETGLAASAPGEPLSAFPVVVAEPLLLLLEDPPLEGWLPEALPLAPSTPSFDEPMAPFAQSWHEAGPVPPEVPQWISAAALTAVIHEPAIPTATTLRRLFMVPIPILIDPIMRIGPGSLVKLYNTDA